jgi:hypothetical protein
MMPKKYVTFIREEDLKTLWERRGGYARGEANI